MTGPQHLPTLPTELFALIIHACPSKRDLVSCSLVNSTFRDLVLPSLYREVNLTLECSKPCSGERVSSNERRVVRSKSKTQTLEGFRELLEKNTAIGRCVSVLKLQSLVNPRKKIDVCLNPRLFLAILESLPRLRVLCLVDVLLDVEQVYPALQAFTTRPSLERLSVTTNRRRNFASLGGRTLTTRMLFNVFEHIQDLYWINRVDEAYQMGLSLPESLQVGAIHVVNQTPSTILKVYALTKSSPRISTLLKSLDLPPTYPVQGTDGYLLVDLLKNIGANLEYLAIGANFLNSSLRSEFVHPRILRPADRRGAEPEEVFEHCNHLRQLVLYLPVSTRLHKFLDFDTVRLWNTAISVLIYAIKSPYNLPALRSVTLKIQSITPAEEERRRRSRILVEKLHEDGRDTHAMDCRQTLHLMDRTLRATVLRKTVAFNIDFVEPSGMRRKIVHGQRLLAAMFPTAMARGTVHLLL